MPPLVSIIIPCHNAGRWLPESLASALGQEGPPSEVILVDDGSTDDSLAIARRHEANGLRILTQENRGQCAACNHGLREARGLFIKFFDADDLLSPGFVARQVAALHDRPGHLAYSEWARFHTDPAEAEFRTRPGWHDASPADWLVETWAEAQPMMQCAQFLIPRELLERVGGWDERLSLINDFEFFARLITASAGVVFTPGARLYYRSGLPGSLSRTRDARAWNSAFLSSNLGIEHLLRLEDSPRTRGVCAGILQELVYQMYPNMPALVRQLETRIATLGGSTLPPQGGKAFQAARRALGWKAARWLQVAGGKYPRPLIR